MASHEAISGKVVSSSPQIQENYMKTIKVTIQDEHTLMLQEDGQKGDVIDLKSLHETDIDKSNLDSVLQALKNEAFEAEVAKERLAIEREKALEAKVKEQELLSKIDLLEKEKASAIELAQSQTKSELQEELAKKESEIAKLQANIQAAETAKKLALTEAINRIEKERDHLAYELKNKEAEQQSEILRLNEKFQNELKTKEEMIAYYKDMKAKLSTKMVGETLEQHCEIEFNKLRATAFQRAYFEKDNDVQAGSKGDYIYRETDEHGNELISIMFEMKNEGDETATKKRNEDFLKELDKDRSQKKCEYGILVSLLESDNELYNSGIVDMSHRYDKMYVIRPQFFIPMITLLRNAALNSLKYKAELALVRSQNIDVTNFENQLTEFQSSFGRSFKLAHDRFSDAIDNIDKSIAQLQKTKENLIKADDHYRIANNKAEDLTIKKLTRGNPTMTEKFNQLREGK